MLWLRHPFHRLWQCQADSSHHLFWLKDSPQRPAYGGLLPYGHTYQDSRGKSLFVLSIISPGVSKSSVLNVMVENTKFQFFLFHLKFAFWLITKAFRVGCVSSKKHSLGKTKQLFFSPGLLPTVYDLSVSNDESLNHGVPGDNKLLEGYVNLSKYTLLY